MECLPKDSILEFHSDTLEVVRKKNGFNTPGQMKTAVDYLEEWVKQQSHFTKKDFTRHYLEMTIITSKGSLERAKARLEKACSLKTLMPQYFRNFDIRNDFKEFNGVITHAVLPKMTKDHTRIFYIRNVGTKFQSNLLQQYTSFLVLIYEYMRTHDYADGYIMVCDLTEVSMFELAKRLSLLELRAGATLLIEGYGLRVKSIHMISHSRIINGMVWLLKQVLSAKIGERIHVHKTIDNVYKFVDKELLPSDFGGKEMSLDALHDAWSDVLSSEEYKSYFKEMSKACIDESQRQNRTTEHFENKDII